jgi:hypothetical protein
MGETFALRRCKKEAKCGQSEHEPDRKAESISLSFPVKPEMRKKAEAQGGYDSSSTLPCAGRQQGFFLLTENDT